MEKVTQVKAFTHGTRKQAEPGLRSKVDPASE